MELTGEVGRNKAADFYRGLERITDELRDDDRIGIVSFNDKKAELRLPLSDDAQAIERSLLDILAERHKMQRGNGERILDALHHAATMFGRRGTQPRRRAVLVLTHNRAKLGRTAGESVTTELSEANATVMALVVPAIQITRNRKPTIGTIFTGPRSHPPVIISERPSTMPPTGPKPRDTSPPNLYPDQHAIDGIVEATGGEILRADYGAPVSWEETMERIRSRYLASFYVPENAEPGETRPIDARLTAQAAKDCANCLVRVRSRYVVP